jgi:hypothetical protein
MTKENILRLAFLVFWLSLSPHILKAQQTTIEGKIVDGETNAPVPFANAYFNHTSIGAVADSVGQFRLEKVPVHLSDLVFSAIGYDVYHLVVSLEPNKVLKLLVKLKPQKHILAEVEIKAKRDAKWKENYERFLREFIGTSTNASSCEITNAGIINFIYKGPVMNAKAAEPIEIVNNALGYKILIDLDRFELGPDYYKISYYSRFENLPTKSERQRFAWEITRLKTYKGSLRHFLQSVISQRVRTEGFRIYKPIEVTFRNGSNAQVMPTQEVAESLLKPELVTSGRFKNYYKFLPKGSYEIHYLKEDIPSKKRAYQNFPHPVSWLESFDDYVYCPSTGNLRSNSNTMVSGVMGVKRLADALPEDYDPIPGEGKIFTRRDADFGTLKGVVVDSSRRRPLPDVTVFINNSSFKAETNKNGEFIIPKIPSGHYTVVAAVGSLVSLGNAVEIKSDSVSNVQVPLSLIERPRWLTNSGEDDLKKYYALEYLVNASAFSSGVKLTNPDALELKLGDKKTAMRSKMPLEIVDQRIGYKISYYLRYAEFPKTKKGKKIVNGFARFDTLSARSPQERRTWITNRDEYYYGTITHLMRSIVEGQSRYDGFKFFMPTETTKKKKRRVFKEIDGESLVSKANGEALFEMTMPEFLKVTFQDDKESKISCASKIKISNLGIFSADSAIRIQGPMKRKEIPVLPVEFIPASETITNPEVLVFVHDNDVKTLDLLSEKAFLHTNKDYYYPGEKIWYKSYIMYGSYLMRDTLSKVLHVELINPEKVIVRNEWVKIKSGVGMGDIALPDTLKPGNYFLRAYTKWGENFGEDHNFLVQVPILPADLNLDQKMSKVKQSEAASNVAIVMDKVTVKPREKVSVKISVKDEKGNLIPSNLSISVTDANRVISGYWNKSIVEDTLAKLQNSGGFHRISQAPEKAVSYDGSIKSIVQATSILITSLNGKDFFTVTPDKQGHFKFMADFSDTASFFFRSNTKRGNFAGHISIDKPLSPEVKTPPLLQLTYKDEKMDQNITYSRDPNDKTTMLEEVVVKATRIQEAPKFWQNSSIVQTPDRVLEAKDFSMVVESAQDPVFFWQLLADKIPGARSDPDALLYIRRWPASFRVNNFPYPVEQMRNLMPSEIDKIEIYNLLALVNIYLKSGPDKTSGPREFDKYTLSGYAPSTTFYMRDYSKKDSTDEMPDLRTTIYWSPNVITDTNGAANVSFYAADIPTRYRIVVQGVNDKGEPVYGEQFVDVKE